MDVPLRIVLGRAAHRRRSGHRLEADVEARIELHAAEVDEAPRLHRDIGKPHRLPEPHGDPGAQTAQAHRQVGIVGIGAVRRPDLEPADRDREQARPADVGDRVDEFAGAAARPGIGRGGRRGGDARSRNAAAKSAEPDAWQCCGSGRVMIGLAGLAQGPGAAAVR